ncbi:MAG: OstA-like protein [Bacteroidota bacterium]|nr:hypothetical protein [Candidatus Kapabacteria bacterium]MDW8219589.1 OstA-like protein [Bacteroidota bacterium]
MIDSKHYGCVSDNTHYAALQIYSAISLCTLYTCAILVVWTLSTPLHAYGQTTDDTQPLLLQADKLTGTMTSNGFVRELIGNVVLTHGTVIITCYRAVHYVEQHRAELFGNVILKQGDVLMKAAQAVYDGFSRSISGKGGVFLRDSATTLSAREGWYSTVSRVARFLQSVTIDNDSLRITCDTLEHHRSTQATYATGSVQASSKRSSAMLEGDSLVHLPTERYTRLTALPPYTSQPIVSQIDTIELRPTPERRHSSSTTSNIRFDTLCIAGNILEAFRTDSSELYQARGNVQLSRRRLAGRAEHVVYERTSSRIRLLPPDSVTVATTSTHHLNTTKELSHSTHTYTRPRLWLDSTQLYADSMLVILASKRIKSIDAYHRALVAMQADSLYPERIHQLQGDWIRISLENDTIRSILAAGKAFSLYFVFSDSNTTQHASEPDGAVRNAADTICILVDGGTIDKILWRGNVEGEYIPEHIVYKQVGTLRLEGFAWMTDRPYLERRSQISQLQACITPAPIKNPQQHNTLQRNTQRRKPPTP